MPVAYVASKAEKGRYAIHGAPLHSSQIHGALEKANGKISGPGGAAQILDINPSTLRKRMKKLGIPYGRQNWRPGA